MGFLIGGSRKDIVKINHLGFKDNSACGRDAQAQIWKDMKDDWPDVAQLPVELLLDWFKLPGFVEVSKTFPAANFRPCSCAASLFFRASL